MSNALEIIGKYRLIPVVKLSSPEQAEPLAKAFIDGGIPIAEVTFRTDAAEGSIKIMCKRFPELLVGAGSLTTIDQCDRAYRAGARFFVSAGFSEKIADFADEHNIPYCPGVATATEIMQALDHGYTVLKLFPAGQLGGVNYIKAIAAPFPGVTFVPTGGVSIDNVCDYLASDKVFAVGGSWLASTKLMEEGKFDEIREIVKASADRIRDFI